MKIYALPQNLELHKQKIRIISEIKSFLGKNGYTEVILPSLSPVVIPESYLHIFQVKINDQGKEFYLLPSPELYLKRLVPSIGDCFYLGKAFRKGESSSLHLPEFIILELYKTGSDYMQLAKELLKMLRFISISLFQREYIFFYGKKISFKKWEKISVSEAFKKHARIEEDSLFDEEKLKESARRLGLSVRGSSYRDVFSQIYTQFVEPYLGMNGYPTLIYDYPAQLSALAKLKSGDKIAERFEFYIGGVELGDCYSELRDKSEHFFRFQKEIKMMEKEYRNIPKIDYNLGEFTAKMPETAGIAIGVDRLAMVFLDRRSLEELEVISFK